MATATKTRRVTPVRGRISPGDWYDAEGLMKATGIGRNTLMELRHTGKLKAHRFCGQGRNWYRGDDVLALMEEVK